MRLDKSDIISGIIGFLIFLLGLIPMLEDLKILNLGLSSYLKANWFVASLPFIVAIGGLYLGIESIMELANSNTFGWLTFFIGLILMVAGILQSLKTFGIGPGVGFIINPLVYQIVFIGEGLFLIIAMIGMEP